MSIILHYVHMCIISPLLTSFIVAGNAKSCAVGTDHSPTFLTYVRLYRSLLVHIKKVTTNGRHLRSYIGFIRRWRALRATLALRATNISLHSHTLHSPDYFPYILQYRVGDEFGKETVYGAYYTGCYYGQTYLCS